MTHEELEALLAQSQQALEQANSTIQLMEGIKFWQLRKLWFKFKYKIGLASPNSPPKPFSETENESFSMSSIPSIPQSDDINYQRWLNKNYPNTATLKAMAQVVEILPYKPVISLIVPIFNTSDRFLREVIESLLKQVYPYWELCTIDDASPDGTAKRILEEYSARDPRIKTVFGTESSHISRCSNTALEIADGEYVALLNQDDLLTPDALYEVALLLNKHPEAGMIYSDEDKIDQIGRLSMPLFKPSWSPHLAISLAYFGHFVCYQRDLVVRSGGFREGIEVAQDYDLSLRVAQFTSHNSIYHIPKVLYHCRVHEESTVRKASSRLCVDSTGLLVINNYLKLRYPSFSLGAVHSEHLFTYRLKFDLPSDLLISIIIPTKDKVELLQPCIQSILEYSSWKNFEIVILNNNSQESTTYDFFEKVQQQDSRVLVVNASIPFNWSKLNNLGADRSSGEVLIFLNNDTKVISPDWIQNLSGYALLPDVGTVGGLLLYEDGTIQHSGVVVGMNSWADHVFKSLPLSHDHSPFISPVLTRNVLAVTGACLAIERRKLRDLGGFDEEFIICGSDVEIGIRAHRNGLFNVMCAEARLYHLESKTRSSYIPEQDFIQSSLKYAPFRLDATDPFYNPNLSLTSTKPSVRSE